MERPYEGLVSIHFELSPMASTSYETGRFVPFPPLSLFSFSPSPFFGSQFIGGRDEVVAAA